MNIKMANNYISHVDNILASLVNTGLSKQSTKESKIPIIISVVSRKKGGLTLIPKNGNVDSLRDFFCI